jgi:hypothetical protein
VISLLVLVVLIGAVAVFTRIAWIADIVTPLRDWAIGKSGGPDSFFGRLISCPYCIAPYLATPLTFATFAIHGALWSWSGLWNAMLTAAAVSFFAPTLVKRLEGLDGTVHQG